MVGRPSLTWVVPDIDERPDARRARKFVALMLILGGVCASTLTMTSVLGVLREAEGSLIILVTSALAVLAIRWNAPLPVVAALSLSVGAGMVVRVALHVGQDGMSVILWLSVAPLIALVVGGRKAGTFVLWASLALMALSLYGISEHWAVERMPAVDRAVLRLGSYELVYEPEVPTAVVISEAVELAKQYSTEKSGRFVNGLLARIAEQVRTPA